MVTSGGVCNYGDDAILLSTLQRLRRIRPNSLASVVSDGPSCPPLGRLGVWSGTCKEFGSGLNPEVVHRGCRDEGRSWGSCRAGSSSARHPRTDLGSFDAVLFAGGGNLNLYWPELIAWRAAIAAAANVAGVPYVLTGQGVGPVSAEIIPMLAFLVGGASAVATRDSLSLDLLSRIVPDGPPMKMVGDDALGLRIDGPLVARGRLAEIGVPLDRPLLAFQAREAPYVGFSRDELKDTARQVDDFAAENGYVVVAVPINMHPVVPEAALLADLAYGSRRRDVARRESCRRRRGDRWRDQGLQRRSDAQLPCGAIRPREPNTDAVFRPHRVLPAQGGSPTHRLRDTGPTDRTPRYGKWCAR